MNEATEREILAELAAARAANGQVHGPTGLGEEPLPSDVYTRDDRYRAEVERIFWQAWVPVARAAEASPGSWLLRRVERAEVVVARDADGALHAFHNTCRHRGSALVTGDGCGQRLVCPYHAWSYTLQGQLASVPDPGAYPPDFDPAQIRLGRVAVDQAWGWIWVHLGADPPPLLAFLGPSLLDELANWRLDGLEPKGRIERDGAFDWKVGVEGFLEPYHVPAVHRRSVHPVIHHRQCSMGWWGDHSRMVMALRDPDLYAPDGFLGRGAAAAGVSMVAGLNRLQQTANLVYLVFPCTILNLLPNHAVALQLLPVGAGRSRLVLDVLGEPGGDRAWWDRLVGSYDALVDEDSGAFTGVQRGLAGPYRPPLTLSHYDRRIRHFRGRLDAWLTASAGPAPGPR